MSLFLYQGSLLYIINSRGRQPGGRLVPPTVIKDPGSDLSASSAHGLQPQGELVVWVAAGRRPSPPHHCTGDDGPGCWGYGLLAAELAVGAGNQGWLSVSLVEPFISPTLSGGFMALVPPDYPSTATRRNLLPGALAGEGALIGVCQPRLHVALVLSHGPPKVAFLCLSFASSSPSPLCLTSTHFSSLYLTLHRAPEAHTAKAQRRASTEGASGDDSRGVGPEAPGGRGLDSPRCSPTLYTSS